MADLIALAERVEKAEGPDRELDKAILLAFGYSWRGMAYWSADGTKSWPGLTHFTTSLDAAMTLVPEGQQFGSGSRDATDKAWAWAGEWDTSTSANAATPALALTAAALRARAAQEASK